MCMPLSLPPKVKQDFIIFVEVEVICSGRLEESNLPVPCCQMVEIMKTKKLILRSHGNETKAKALQSNEKYATRKKNRI